MGAHDDVLVRIDEIEAELRDLFGELHEMRALVSRTAAVPAAEMTEVTAVAMTAPAPVPEPAAVAPKAQLSPQARREAAIVAARILLSEGRPTAALDELERAIADARAHGDEDGLRHLGTELQGIARYRPLVRDRALELVALARATLATRDIAAPGVPPAERAPAAPPAAARPTTAPQAAPAQPRVAHAAVVPRPAPPAAPPRPPRRSVAELARDWDLLGPRGFAIVGGAVTALGITLLFVLATNRGWITPAMRVLMGAAVSALAVGVGFWVRKRYGQMQMSLGAVGAGIAGGYASLAAAAARYDLVPDWLALPLAGVIAAIAVAIAIAWSSETVAAIGLVGAALAPALQAIDTGMTWPAAAFAVIVLVATLPLSVPRRWQQLLIGIAAIVTAQVGWLAHASDGSADAGTTAVVAALVLAVLAAGIWLQLASETKDLDPLAVSFALAAVGLALLLVRQLFDADRDMGLALAVAAVVWATAWLVLRRSQPSLALVLGVSSLTLAAVASADLLSGTGLAVTWAAESVLLSALAWRLHDARLQLTALAYAVLAGANAFTADAPPDVIFHAPVSGAAAGSIAALAAAVLAAGLLAPAETVPRTESGLLAWLAVARAELAKYRDPIRQWLVFAGAALGTYAAALALVSISFRPGHLAATILAAAVGAAVTAFSARRGSLELVAASLAWLAGVYLVALAFDVPEFMVEAVHRSYGGWALIGAAAGVLAGAFAFQLLFPNPGPPVVPAFAGVVALASTAAGIALVSPPGDVLTSSWIGWRLLAPAVVFAALSAGVFRIERHRDLATIMWALATTALLGSEWLVVQDPTWRAVAFAVTAAALASLAGPLRESRFWFAGWGLTVATAVGAIGWGAQPWALVDDQPVRLALGPLAAALALFVVAGLAWRDSARRDLVTCAWAVGVVALLDAEAFAIQNGMWIAVAFAATAAVVAALERPLREQRLWLAGWTLSVTTAAGAMLWLAQPWALVDDQPVRLALGALAAAAALFGVAALAWRDPARRDLVTCAWALGIVALLDAEAFAIQDVTWIAVAFAATAGVVAALERPLREPRLWLAGWVLASGTAFVTSLVLAGNWLSYGPEPARYAIAAFGAAAAVSVVCGLAWRVSARRDLITGAWGVGVVTLILGEAFVLGGGPSTAFAAALTGGAVALLTVPLREERLWWAGAVVVSVTSAAVLVLLTPPTHFLTASASPGQGLWVAIGCLVAGIALHLSGSAYRRWVDAIGAVGALYVLSLAILELAERAFGGSVQTDFERGHVLVSSLWALIGLALLVAGLIRDERLLRFGGLALFGLSLAKIFLYDLSTLSSVARAFSFIAVGALVLAGGFFLQKLSSHMGPRRPRMP